MFRTKKVKGMALIELMNIHKIFRDGESHRNHLLRGVNLQVEAGDFVAIKGASGVGKTTLLQILGTLISPDEGQYWLDGHEVTKSSTDLAEIRNKQIGFVFQDHRLMPAYTVMQNILLPTLATSQSASVESTERAESLMHLVGIDGIAHQYPETLSGGESSRVAVCRALIQQPLLLLADEPTGQLDGDNAQKIVGLFQRINEQLHTTVIMVTHSDETAKAAHRVLTLKDGILQE